MFVGIDFGTSNSSIAAYIDGKLRLFRLDPLHVNPVVLPSFTYISRDHKTFVGINAIDTYLEEETGRRPVWEKRNLGQVEITVGGPGKGPIVYMQDMLIDVDVAAKGRLLQSIKTGLRDPKYAGTQIFDRFYTIEELISLLLIELKQKCETELGSQVTQAVIGRPVNFSYKPDADQMAQEKILAAAKMAGFSDVVFELEPIGGAYVYHQNSIDREIVLVFDFGGGTLDMTIIEVGGKLPPEVIATQGVLLGGDDLTGNLMETFFPVFGEGSIMDDGLPVPSHIYEMLYSWQNIVELSRPKYAEVFKKAKSGQNPAAIERLETLVQKKLGFRLFQELEKVKIELSSKQYTHFLFKDAGMNLTEIILRSRFEQLISGEVENVRNAIEELMRKSGLRDERIDAVLRTGGTSEVPVFIDLLTDRFGMEKIIELNPFTSIVAGLAIKGADIH